MKFFQKSTYRRIMLIYLAAMLLLYIFSLLMYRASVQSLQKEMVESVTLIEQNYIQQMEHSFVKAKEQIATCVLRQDWSLLTTKRGPMNDFDTLQLVLHAQERLQAIKNSSIFLRDVEAHLKSWGRSISAEHGLEELKEDEFNALKMPLHSRGAQFMDFEGDLHITSAYDYEIPVMFSITAVLDKYEMELSLSALNSMDNSSTLLIGSSTGQILASSGVRLPPQALGGSTGMSGDLPGSFNLKSEGIDYICVYYPSGYLGFTLVNFLPSSQLYQSLNKYYNLIGLFSAVVLAIIIMFFLYTYKNLGKPMNTLIDAFRLMEKGDFSIRIKTNPKNDFVYLYNSFDKMAENIQQLVDEGYKKELLVQRASLKQLQSQINPHFLYNSFYILHRMIKLGDLENAEVFSSYLGKYFKYITRDARDDVPLSTEVEHAMTYANIMAVRFSHKIRVEFDQLPPEFAGLSVPRMLMQPLLENAFEHGLRDLPGEGVIHIFYKTMGEDIFISIEDNGTGITEEELVKLNEKMTGMQMENEVTGIANIHRRVRLMFGENYGISIGSSVFGGMSVTLKLGGKVRREI